MAAESESELDLVFLWHMHQPDYRAPENGNNALPWVYLHTIKDYADMVGHLERHPGISAVVNFVPILLEQIEDYVDQLASPAMGGLRDPLLRLLAHPEPATLTLDERQLAVERCFLSKNSRMTEPFPAYKRLHELFSTLDGHRDNALQYLSGEYFTDLVAWYHLAWMGETVRRQHALVPELMRRGEGFSHQDRLALLELIHITLDEIIPRYRALAERGKIELSTSPYSHPLAPLLIDFQSARESLPDLPLPSAPCYPGGRERVDAQISAAIACHNARFGTTPSGVWPAEGALSTALIRQLANHGVRWTASSEAVLNHSLSATDRGYSRSRDLYRPYRLAAVPGTVVFFRDDRLSDLIGFEYAKWYGHDAAQHFVAQLDTIRREAIPGQRPLVCVILDGENAWENYPYNGYHFFEDLYGLLDQHPHIHTTTFSNYLSNTSRAEQIAELPQFVAGSWVFGTMTTWIGDSQKNRAWDLLCAAKQSYDQLGNSERIAATVRDAASKRLAVCESSDWFWWLGDYNSAETVIYFDEFFRRNLRHFYRLLELEPPDTLSVPLNRDGSTPEAGGTMRRSS